MDFRTEYRSLNFNSRTNPPDMIIMHYTGMKSAGEALTRLCGKESNVSSHYVVDENGTIYALVDEQNRAWHAGLSYWQGEKDINNRSVGIEIVNPGHEFGYRPFPELQIQSVIALTRDIIARHKIKPARILGHSDIAPLRKQDPGELFPWKQLAHNGIGLWTDDFGSATENPVEMMQAIGYDTSDVSASLTAFRRHFYPDFFLYSPKQDRTLERLNAVARLYKNT